MENPQYNDALPIVPVLEHVSGVEHLQYDLPVFFAAFYRAPEQRMLG